MRQNEVLAIAAFIVVALFIVGLAVWASVEGTSEWEAYREAHHCQRAVQRGTYVCDGGEVIWR